MSNNIATEQVHRDAAKNASKPGWQTTELWVGVFANIGAICAASAGVLPVRFAAYMGMASTASYAISRGLTKLGALLKKP